MRPESPITLKEKLLAKMDGDEVNIPEKVLKNIPIEHMLIASIAGLPVDISGINSDYLPRKLRYIASIAGIESDIPDPITHFEYILARAAGVLDDCPEPITREEMYWYDYESTPQEPKALVDANELYIFDADNKLITVRR